MWMTIHSSDDRNADALADARQILLSMEPLTPIYGIQNADAF